MSLFQAAEFIMLYLIVNDYIIYLSLILNCLKIGKPLFF